MYYVPKASARAWAMVSGFSIATVMYCMSVISVAKRLRILVATQPIRLLDFAILGHHQPLPQYTPPTRYPSRESSNCLSHLQI